MSEIFLHRDGFCKEHEKLRMLCCPVCFQEAVDKAMEPLESLDAQLKADLRSANATIEQNVAAMKFSLSEQQRLTEKVEQLQRDLEMERRRMATSNRASA